MSHSHHAHEHHEHQDKAPHAENHAQHHDEHAARAPVDAPEADAVQEARPEPKAPEAGLVATADAPLMPVEKPMHPPVQAVAVETTVKTEEVKHPVPGEAELLEAEQKIAPYIGAKLSNDLTDGGLDLNFKEYANGNDKYGIKLCFQGPALNTKAAELGHQVLAALREHTAFAPLFKHEDTAPRTDKGSEADMMHVLIPNLSREQYIKLVDQVRGIVHEKEQKHGGTAIAPAKKEHIEGEAPKNMVQGPVAALDKGIANDNEIAPQGVAL